jgi:hypothetical protein
MTARFDVAIDKPDFGFSIKTVEGVLIYSTCSSLLGLNIGPVDAGECIELLLDCPLQLSTGIVFLDFTIFTSLNGGVEILDARLSAAKIEIMGSGKCYGIIDAGARMRILSQPQSPA